MSKPNIVHAVGAICLFRKRGRCFACQQAFAAGSTAYRFPVAVQHVVTTRRIRDTICQGVSIEEQCSISGPVNAYVCNNATNPPLRNRPVIWIFSCPAHYQAIAQLNVLFYDNSHVFTPGLLTQWLTITRVTKKPIPS